ncbi:filamentous hemagglutinin N-terminal domain-containing protein [Paraherbaspirillum soli]|uniref:Filamentous hemagglutinin N-terminal domain-containing protein n=1 Tax=Paraherbaspirillum soli TaxID=631222 RepID=A0ABW0MFM8_9BURK
MQVLPPTRTRLAVLIGLWFGSVGLSFANGIVTDGGSVTHVVTAANGRQTVNIAPAVAGVSHNTYNQFNVGQAGVDLNNVGVNARNIVNQVTSTNPSLIQGDITVVGPRANVILANPNGITVNGGKFINTGNVALTTGQVTFNDFSPAPGLSQRNIKLDTNRGQITIGPDGLSGAMLSLELSAKTLVVNGPVNNSFSGSAVGIRATVGDSHAEIDGSVSPTDNLTPWLATTAPHTANAATAIDITPLGSLTAGRITLVVTDQGAGVHHAGAIYANVGDFSLAANGDIKLAGGSITAANNLAMANTNGDINLAGSSIKTANNLVMASTSGAINLVGSDLLAAGNISTQSAGLSLQNDGAKGTMLVAENGGVLLNSSADILNQGSWIQGRQRIAGNSDSQGAVMLKAGGNITNVSPTADLLAIIFSKSDNLGNSDDVLLQAGANIVNHHGRILSNKALQINAQGDVDNIVDKQSGANGEQGQTYQTRDSRWLLLSERTHGFDIDYGQVARADDHLAFLKGETGVAIKGRNVVNRGGVIQADSGDIGINAALVFHNEALFDGQAHFRRSCLILCRASASSTVQSHGGLLTAGNNIDIQAGTEASNLGGNVSAAQNLNISAPKVLAQGIVGYRSYQQSRGFKAWFGNSWARLYAMDLGGSWTAKGKLRINGQGVIDGGSFDSPDTVVASNGIVTLRPAQREPVSIEHHLGLTSWIWQ